MEQNNKNIIQKIKQYVVLRYANLARNKKFIKILKFLGISISIVLGVIFWYLSIPCLIIWYLYKKDKNLSEKNKQNISIVVAIIFFVVILFLPDKKPSLIIFEPVSGISVDSEKILIKGKVSPRESELFVNGNLVNKKRKKFQYYVELKDEKNSIFLEAVNGDRKTSQIISVSRIFTEEQLLQREKEKEYLKNKKEEEIKQRIQKEIDSIKSFDGSVFRGSNSAHMLELAIFSSYASIIGQYKNYPNDSIKKLVSELEKKVSQLQVNEFPKLRKDYVDIIRKAVWEHNIDVSYGGSLNKNITFTASMFASNANIKEVHVDYLEAFSLLRFTRANYKWYKYDDEYTYFTIESEPDSKVFVVK